MRLGTRGPRFWGPIFAGQARPALHDLARILNDECKQANLGQERDDFRLPLMVEPGSCLSRYSCSVNGRAVPMAILNGDVEFKGQVAIVAMSECACVRHDL